MMDPRRPDGNSEASRASSAAPNSRHSTNTDDKFTFSTYWFIAQHGLLPSDLDPVHRQGHHSTYFVPVLVGELVARVSPLDSGAGHQDIGLDTLAVQRGHNLLDSLAVRQLGHMDPRLAPNAVDDLVLGGRVGGVPLIEN